MARGVAGGRRDLFFRGNFGDGQYRCHGGTVYSCSAGARPWLREYLAARAGVTSNGTIPSAKVGESGGYTGIGGGGFPSNNLLKGMESAWYALCPAGAGCWSTRLFDAIDRLAVPVIISDGAVLPFCDLLDYSSFAIFLDTTAITRCPERARSTPSYGASVPYSSSPGKSPRAELIKESLCPVPHTAPPQLQRLHDLAGDIRRLCGNDSALDYGLGTSFMGGGRGSRRTEACAELGPVRMIQRLAEVRRWFHYDPTSPYSAWGLFLLELDRRRRCHPNLGTDLSECGGNIEKEGPLPALSKGAGSTAHSSPPPAEARPWAWLRKMGLWLWA